MEGPDKILLSTLGPDIVHHVAEGLPYQMAETSNTVSSVFLIGFPMMAYS